MLETEMTYYSEYESFCYQNCMRQILEYYHVRHAGLYINSALDLSLTLDDKFDYGYHIYLEESSRSVVPRFQQKISKIDYDFDAGMHAWEINRKRIDEDIPIIAGVDVFFLPYSHYFHKSHGNHTLILNGYLEDEKLVQIIDWYDPWYYKGTVPFDVFIKARSSANPWDGSIYSGVAIRNNWTELDKQGWDAEPGELIGETLNLTIAKYFSASLDGNNTTHYKGIAAIEKIGHILLANIDMEQEQRSNFLKDLHRKLYAQLMRHRLFRLYLVLSSQWIDKKSMNIALEQLDTLITYWNITMMFILKSSMSASEKSYLKIANHLNEIIACEDKLHESVSNIVRGL
jgi:hypothetical protein